MLTDQLLLTYYRVKAGNHVVAFKPIELQQTRGR